MKRVALVVVAYLLGWSLGAVLAWLLPGLLGPSDAPIYRIGP